ncbi:MAG: M48 family metalloprotease [Planctomycetota bacterium]|nr:M48 family metalloprotease [Planctomycetota bacterium]
MTQFGYGNSGSSGSGITLRLIIGVVIAIYGIVTYLAHTSVNPTTGEKQHVHMTSDQEIALGLQSAPQMAAQMGGEAPASDPDKQEVSKVGNTVVDHSDAHNSPYHYQFHLLNDQQTVNAFALPGGQVFITRALYDKLTDEAELAGVLGHESGHVVERHSAQQVEKGRLGETLVVATGIASSDRQNGYAATAMAQMADQMIQLRFSRADESQADQRGLQFMTEAGYDPRAMIDVMKILQSISAGGNTPEFLQTHPDPGNRIEAIQEWLSANPDRSRELTRGNKLH